MQDCRRNIIELCLIYVGTDAAGIGGLLGNYKAGIFWHVCTSGAKHAKVKNAKFIVQL